MRVWIVRHGKAEANSDSGKDADRALADRGRDQARWLGKKLVKHADAPGRIISSPIKRALDTARLINKAVDAPLEESALLETGRPASDAMKVIGDHTDSQPLMIVGHNPTLEKLVGILTRGPGAEAEMRTGQAVLIELDCSAMIGRSTLIESLRFDDE
jgi:phosphohistidine phosphatase